jgi:hypothetical protein
MALAPGSSELGHLDASAFNSEIVAWGPLAPSLLSLKLFLKRLRSSLIPAQRLTQCLLAS